MIRWVWLFLFSLTACGVPGLAEPTPTPTCVVLSAPFLAEIQPLAREWDDASALAGQTPRSALAQQIESLQAVRRKAQDVQAPDCAAAVKTALVESMEATITGYIAFLGQKPDREVNDSFAQASERMQAFTAELGRMNGIEPPTPTALPPTTAPDPTQDRTPRPVTIDYHKEVTVYTGPGKEYVVVRSFYNPRSITFLAQRNIKRTPWYRVKIEDTEGWVSIFGLGSEITQIVPDDTSDLPPTPAL